MLNRSGTSDDGQVPRRGPNDDNHAMQSVSELDNLPEPIRKLSVFAHLPGSNLTRIAQCLERLSCTSGEFVVNQGDLGAHYYIIESGECEVLREIEDGDDVLLALLRAGDAFGEEALVSGAPRNATVRMRSDGVLLRLTRDNFSDLVKAPLVHEVDHTRAEDLVAIGATWLDVRQVEEHEADALEKSVNIPLVQLREQMNRLSHDRTYVVYCDTGQRSAAATFLLSERGFAACCLSGGLAAGRPETRHTPVAEPAELAELGAELIEANAALEQALQDKAHADAELDIEMLSLEKLHLDEHARLTERLKSLEHQAESASQGFEAAKQRKLELERRLREGTAAAAARRRQAQEQLDRLRREAETRLSSEKHRLQTRYKEAAERLQALERERKEAEQRFEAERQKLEQEFEDARLRLESEAQSVRDALEGDRKAAEHRAVQIRDAASKAQRELRDQTESELKSEQARLASEFARSVAEQEQARQDLELAEVARKKAEEQMASVKAAIDDAAQRREAAQQAQQEAEEARKKAEEARLRAEREAAEARRKLAEARQQLAAATTPEIEVPTAAAKAAPNPATDRTDDSVRDRKGDAAADKAVNKPAAKVVSAAASALASKPEQAQHESGAPTPEPAPETPALETKSDTPSTPDAARISIEPASPAADAPAPPIDAAQASEADTKGKSASADPVVQTTTQPKAKASAEPVAPQIDHSDESSSAQNESALDNLNQLEDRLRKAQDQVESAKREEAEFARAERTAAVTQAKEEELRLQLFEEMEDWVEEERQRSEQDAARFAAELKRLEGEKKAREDEAQQATEGLLADIEQVLADPEDDDPFDEFIRMRTMAEETNRVVTDAKAALEVQRAESERALAEANARINQHRESDEPNKGQ